MDRTKKKEKFPSIKDQDFSKDINSKYSRYTILPKKKTFKEICFPKKYELQVQQKFLSNYINPDTPYKGVLIFHKIGAGKTCTAISIAEKWKHTSNIIILVPASLIGNFRTELRSPCAGNSYLTEVERDKLADLQPGSQEYRDIIHKSDRRIDKYYKIYSYNKFIELAENRELSLNNTLIIIDEVQNIVSESGKFYAIISKTIEDAPSTLRVVLMSATPMFDKPVEIALTMNLLRLPTKFPTGSDFDKLFIKKSGKSNNLVAKNLDLFKNMIRGYVSYFRGAPPYVFPTSSIKYVNCEMSSFQYKSYLTVAGEELITSNNTRSKVFHEGGILDLPNNFFIGTRMVSNIAFPNKNIGEKGFDSLVGSTLEFKNLKKYSIKFYKIAKKILRSTGPVFVYSNFKEYGGIKSFVRVLEYHGYSNYTTYGEGRKRFAIWSSDEDSSLKEEIKAVFNKQDNISGGLIKIFIGSPSSREGLSLLNVRQVHILEPYWNTQRLAQIMGRANRFCSHKLLSKQDREVSIYIYLATHLDSDDETIDQYIAEMAMKKNRLIEEFETAIKEVAVDCEIFKNANVYSGESDIICDL